MTDLTWDQKNDPGCPDCEHSILMHALKGGIETKVFPNCAETKSCTCQNQRVA